MKKRTGKLLSLLLVPALLLGMLPMTAIAAEATEITEIKSVISAEHVPKAGMEVDHFIPNVPDGEHYSRPWNGADWYDSNGVRIAPTVNHHYDLGYEFEAGHTYYADYQYTASDGYVFAQNPTITLTGPDPSMFTYEIIDRWDNNEAVTVRYTFTIPGEFENADINKVSMQYYGTPKDGGKKPDRCELIYNNCTITGEEWNTGTWGSNANWGVYEEDGSNAPTFLAGETYVHMIELTAKNGYQFAQGLHVQKGTQDAEEYGVVTLSADRTVATVKFTYEIPEIEIINTIELRAANQHLNFCLRSGESIYLPQPFVPKYVLSADCPYEVENVNSCDWINDETGEYLELGYPHTFENAKKYTLRFHVKIKDEFETTHKFASGTDLGLNVTDYAYANSSFVDFKVSGGGTTATVEVTFTVQFPEGAGSSADNPAMCYSYEAFKYAMESNDIRYVALGNVEDTLPMIPHDPEVDDNREIAIVVRGKKDLNLLGNATFTCPVVVNYDYKTYEELITLADYADSDLYIHGTGSLTFEGSNMQFYNSVIRVQGGSLTVDGATIVGSHGTHTGYCYGINALYGSVGILGGATIRGGVYDTAGIYAFSVGSEGITRSLSVSIWDGKFYVDRVHEGGYTDGGQYIPYVDYGISVQNDVGLRIYGMTSDGIELGRYAADTLADYVMDGSVMTVNGVKTDPASCGTTGGIVEVFREVSKVNIHVNSPVAGESPAMHPEDIYLVPDGVTAKDPVWYENGQLWNISNGSERFEAGSTYTVQLTLVADAGVKFANPLASATINYKDAEVSAFAGNWESGIVMTLAFGECPNIVPQVDLTVTAPKEGNKPSYTIGCGSDAYYAVGGSSNYTEYRQWYESSNGINWTEMSTSTQFKAGYYYKLYVDIRTNEGYEFPLIDVGTIQPGVNATVNGYTATVRKAYDQDPDRYITVEYNFGECSDSVVNSIIVENVTPPVAGEKPNYNWSIRGTGYQMDTSKNAYYDVYWKNPPEKWYYVKNGISWWDVTDGGYDYVYENDTFIPGHEYQCKVYLRVEDGFEFAYDNGTVTVTATMNGNAADVKTEGSGLQWNQEVTYTFTCELPEINTVILYDLEKPVAGETPDTSVTPAYPEYYTVESVRWLDEEDGEVNSFEQGRLYTVEITVAAAVKSGMPVCAFADPVTAYIDGTEVTGWSNTVTVVDDYTVTLRYSFRKPAQAPEVETPKAFLTQPVGGTLQVGDSLNIGWETTFVPEYYNVEYWDGEAWDQWDCIYTDLARADHDFENDKVETVRFRIVAYLGGAAAATSNEFTVTWRAPGSFSWNGNDCTVTVPTLGSGVTAVAVGYRSGRMVSCAFVTGTSVTLEDCDTVRIFYYNEDFVPVYPEAEDSM